MGVLLQEAFRALRLSLLVVGENGGDGYGEGDAGKGSEVAAAGGGGELEGRESPHGDASAVGTSRSSRSVNANGHMGMVSVDCRGHTLSSPVGSAEVDAYGRTPEREEALGSERTPGAGRSGAEGQRTVVGAWLLVKEACRCLATMVTVLPLPLANKGATAFDGASKGADAPSFSGETGQKDANPAESKALLTDEDVTAVGEALLESLLSLKHMGCVTSAQVPALQYAAEEALL